MLVCPLDEGVGVCVCVCVCVNEYVPVDVMVCDGGSFSTDAQSCPSLEDGDISGSAPSKWKVSRLDGQHGAGTGSGIVPHPVWQSSREGE